MNAPEGLGILIVDDNVDVAHMLSVLVGSWGYRARVARTAAAAMDAAKGFEPRVVLLDLGLPDEHGYRLAARLRGLAGDRPMAFVAITGWSQVADQIQSTAAGFSHHLVKPLEHDALRAILDGYQAAEQRTLVAH